MVCPTPRSGKLGFVGDYTSSVLTRFRRVRNWSFNATANPERRIYSGTRFGTQRIPSFVEYTGSFSGFGAVPPLFPGDEFTFLGYTAPTNGVPCTPGCTYTVLGLVDSLTINWNWTAENKGVNWTINFSSNDDADLITNFDDPCDDEVYCDDNPCDLTLELFDPCDSDAPVEWCNLVSAALTFTAANNPYSNSSTNCIVKREIGNLDWTLAVVDQNTCMIPTVNADYLIKIKSTVSPATYWVLEWGQFQGLSDFTVDTETSTIISKANNFAMQAVSCCVPGSPERGSIVSPDGTTVWPYSAAS